MGAAISCVVKMYAFTQSVGVIVVFMNVDKLRFTLNIILLTLFTDFYKIYDSSSICKNTLWVKCFTTPTNLASHLFLLSWLVKTESDLIIRSVETGLGR